MNEPLLVDSSIYIDLLRAGKDIGLWFRSRIEVLHGIVDRRIREWMERLFDEMTDCTLDDELIRVAADLAWRLDRKEIILPVPDLLIAACSLRAGAAVVTTAPHFRLVPDLKVLAEIATG